MEIKKAYGKSIHKDQVEFAFDNNQLTSAATKEEEYWIGATLKSDQQLISKIELVPKNDGNFITVNHNYELFYFDNKWISIGKRIATSRKLYYEDVPKGAVLLLRNLTEGNEERIFTMKDSVQVWW
ncbi:hypothetical protein B0I21_11615 [Sphingobacterium paludis]|uniref:Uncharacterized protein n=2 Tax=Sphingobacterium paludis TaxID=1476465 RepID=A0A4R7CRY5_9SPHI|nr:hypothetical protein B0I21_11615 [Sphingobacterium paludis]